MKCLSTPKSNGYPAPCRSARRLLTLAITASALAIIAIAADLLLSPPHLNETAGAWMNALTLTAPSLWPAGGPMRHPETVHPGVDLRFSPGLVAAP